MARCALVQTSDNVVVNFIVADASLDPAPEGHFLVDADNFPQAQVGWVYDPVMIDFVDPNKPAGE